MLCTCNGVNNEGQESAQDPNCRSEVEAARPDKEILYCALRRVWNWTVYHHGHQETQVFAAVVQAENDRDGSEAYCKGDEAGGGRRTRNADVLMVQAEAGGNPKFLTVTRLACTTNSSLKLPWLPTSRSLLMDTRHRRNVSPTMHAQTRQPT